MVKRAADMLQSGAIMGKVLQPHYSHVPYNLQFMMDYNLQGMNFIHLSHCLFRTNRNPDDAKHDSSMHLSDDPESRLFDEKELPVELLVPETVKRVSNTELEVDAVAADILNSNQDLMQSSLSFVESNDSIFKGNKKPMNPGLEALWDDERFRRLEMEVDQSERLTPPSSPPRNRDADFQTDSQKFWEERFSEMMERFKSQGLLDKPSSSKEDQTNIYPPEAPDNSILPNATSVEDHVGSLSETITSSFEGTLNVSKKQRHLSKEQELEKQSLFNQTVVDEDLLSQTLSQKSEVKPSGDDEDEDDLVELLQGLKAERDEPSQSWFLDEQDDLEMSQICTDTDPFLLLDPEFEEIESQLASKAAAKKQQSQSFGASINWEDEDWSASQVEFDSDEENQSEIHTDSK